MLICTYSKALCCGLLLQVYMLGEGEESKEWLSIPGHSIDQLFLSHVTKVAKGIRETYPRLGVIMWDDMLRNMTSDTITGELTLHSFVLLRSTYEKHHKKHLKA